jgi:hypothetical protein
LQGPALSAGLSETALDDALDLIRNIRLKLEENGR